MKTDRVDSHQHFWAYNEEEYGWIRPEHTILRRDYLPEDLSPLLTAAGFQGTVAVQARQILEETRWLLELADKHGMIRGVVVWVDLRLDELRAQLDRFADHEKLVGVRHVVHDEPDDLFMLRPDFQRGVGALRDYNLTYDLLLFPRHLGPAIDLVDAFPNQPFVVDRTVSIVGKGGENQTPRVEVVQGVGIDIQLSAGQRATLARIDVAPDAGSGLTQGVRIQGGDVTLEDCRIFGDSDPTGSAGLATVDVVDADVQMAFTRIEEGAA